MKKLLYFIFLLGTGFISRAQNPSFVPSSFTAEDQVTLTIDVSGTNMAGAADAYIWIFSNPDLAGGNNGIVNGDWTNSSNDAKLTNAGPNKWKFTFTGTTLFGKSPAELKSFGFLLKKKDGSAQTPDYKSFFFDPLVFTPTMLRVFPAKVGADDAITLNFDRAYAVIVNEQRMTPVSISITMLDDQDPAVVVGSTITIPVVKTGTTTWSGSFIPSESFTPAAGKKLAKFKYRFNGTILGPDGATVAVSFAETEVVLTAMQ